MYNIAIYLFCIGVHLASLFKRKIAMMCKGQKGAFRILEQKLEKNESYIWFHAASLGEFEQGRPLLEEIRRRYPQYKILQTFFSPSGYEVRKHYEGADVVCYLPLDTPCNAKRFVELVKPKMAFFIKYEFWKNYLDELHHRQVPTYSVSSIFREEQIFFRSYGKTYREVLKNFTHIFVQNEPSKDLLRKYDIVNVTVTGDTRFDRVLDICRAAKQLPIAESFRGNAFTLVAGSSWQADEEIFIPHINALPDVKIIIAPHVVDEAHLSDIEKKIQGKTVRYSKATEENVKDAKCLLIDGYGLLSSLYRYGDLAYIGGGFGVGIHNIAEAAVYGIPVLFGPNHERFKEAIELKACGGGFVIQTEEDFDFVFNRIRTNPEALAHAGHQAGSYVATHAGAVQRIMTFLNL